MSDEQTTVERRQKNRDCPGRRYLDLHYDLERRHTQLGKRLDTLTITVHELVDAVQNNYRDVMNALQRVLTWTEDHQRKDSQTQHLLAIIGAIGLLMLAVILVKIV